MTEQPTEQPKDPSADADVRRTIEEIFSHARADFSAHQRARFSEPELSSILGEARSRLMNSLELRAAADPSDVRARWNEVVTDFYENEFWGYGRHSLLPSDVANSPAEVQDPKKELAAFLRSFLVPVLITKSFLFFFGVQYSKYPGEGYGWGLLFMIAFTLSSFLYFVVKQSKNYPMD
jgi:hypothetical protein